MNIPHLDQHYDELCTYGNIDYTPAWYYKHFPGFFNVQCYKILAGWQGGVRSEEQYLKDESEHREQENKKRRLDCVDTEDGVHSEFQRTHPEGVSEFKTSRELPLSQS